MFENITKFFKKFNKNENKSATNSRDAAKERLHLVLMQDRANVSADFLELMKQEIIEVIKKYIDVDETAIDVRLTNKENGDGTNGAPALYANIPIINIKNEARKVDTKKAKEVKEEKELKKENEDKEAQEDKKNQPIKEKVKTEKAKNQEQVDEKIELNKEEKSENEDKKEINKQEETKTENQEIKEQKTTEQEENKKSETKEAIKSKN